MVTSMKIMIEKAILVDVLVLLKQFGSTMGMEGKQAKGVGIIFRQLNIIHLAILFGKQIVVG